MKKTAFFFMTVCLLQALSSCNNDAEEGWGYIDKTGKMVIKPQFLEAGTFNEGIAVVGVVIDGKKVFGYIDNSGDWIINPQFSQASPLNEGTAVVEKDNTLSWLVLDSLEQKGIILPLSKKTLHAWPFSEGLACFANQGKTILDREYGFVDMTGEVAIPAVFMDAHPF